MLAKEMVPALAPISVFIVCLESIRALKYTEGKNCFLS